MSVINRNRIVTNGLILNLDGSNIKSYPFSGSTNWFDISGINNSGIISGNTTYNNTTKSIYSLGVASSGAPSRDISFPTSISLPGTGSSWTLNTLVSLNYPREKTNNDFNISYNLNKSGRIIWQMLHNHSITKILEANNSIYVSGNFSEYGSTDRPFIIKLSSTGVIDNNFNCGFTITQTQTIDDIVMGSNNELYFNGYNLGTSSGLLPRVGKVNNNTGVYITGITTTTMNATITLGNMVLDESLNHLYVCGWFTSINGVPAQYFARLFSNTFTIDTSFNTRVGFSPANSALAVALQTDKKVLVGGSFTSYSGESFNRLIRLSSDGTIDRTFNIGSGFAGGSVSIGCIKIQSDDRILVGGAFTSYTGVSANRIIRLNTDGGIDPTFVYGTGFNGDVYSIAIQSDNKILLGGNFTAYNGSSCGAIVRLNTGGTIDTSFVTGSGFNVNNVNAITVQSNGKILVGGRFASYSGVTANNLIRLNSDGSIDGTFNSGAGVFGPYRPNLQIYYRNSSNSLTFQTIFNVPPSAGGWFNYSNQMQYFNKFVMLTITKDITDTYKTYWNGVSSGAGTSVAGSTDTGLNIEYIGKGIFNQSVNAYMSGNTLNSPGINVYQVYNRELTPTEVSQNFNALRTRYNL